MGVSFLNVHSMFQNESWDDSGINYDCPMTYIFPKQNRTKLHDATVST